MLEFFGIFIVCVFWNIITKEKKQINELDLV